MAISFINAAHSTDIAGAVSTDITCNKPTNTADNDIMFAFVVRRANTGAPTSVPSGWTALSNYTVSSWSMYIYWKVAASEGSSYTWQFDSTAGGKGVSIGTYRGNFNTSNPIQTYSSGVYETSDTTLRATTVTTNSANQSLIFIGSGGAGATQSSTAATSPGNFTKDFDRGGNNQTFSFRTMHHFDWSSSGATGNVDATINFTQGSKHAWLIALNPPSTGSTSNFLQFF